MLYPVAIQQKNKVFHAHFPDMPELKINDNSMADTIANARQTVINHLKDLFEEDLSIPEATDINIHLTNPKYAGWTWAIVNIDLHRVIGEEVTINVKISQKLNLNINNFLLNNDVSLNDFLVAAIKEKINR